MAVCLSLHLHNAYCKHSPDRKAEAVVFGLGRNIENFFTQVGIEIGLNRSKDTSAVSWNWEMGIRHLDKNIADIIYERGSE